MRKIKNKFYKSTLILIIGGLITKVLGMFNRIITTRLIGSEGIGIYMLLLPTFMLFISLSQLGFNVAVSVCVSENKFNNKKLVLNIIPVSLLINFVLFLIILFSASFISNNLLHETRTYYGILAIGFVLPFISISSIIRGYFFGKQNMFPHVISNIIEDIFRLIILILFIPLFIQKGLSFAIFFLVISNTLSELISIIVLILFLPKRNIDRSDFIINKKYIKTIFNIGIPTTGSRIIGSIGSFLEPIIMTYVLLKINYSKSFIINEYGILNGYVLPILMLPSFFTLAISQALIPIISENYNKNKLYTKNKLKQALLLSFIIGIFFTVIIELFPSFILKLIYNTNNGITYLQIIAPIFLLSYIQTPLTSCMQAMNKAKEAMNGTIIGVIIRTLLLFILSYLKIGLWGLVIAMSTNILFVTIHHYLYIKKFFK
ncbi:MAG: oligosaccharide flippase family protein [Bacilli bacterium]|nr:oligosaccharide flippase family protein [Bacilli bacterium]